MNAPVHALVWSKVREAMDKLANQAEKDGATGAQREFLVLSCFAAAIANAYREVR